MALKRAIVLIFLLPLGGCGTVEFESKNLKPKLKINDVADSSQKYFKKIGTVTFLPRTTRGGEVKLDPEKRTKLLAANKILRDNTTKLVDAVREGLKFANLYHPGGPLILNVADGTEKMPGFGSDMIVTVSVKYEILNGSTKKIVGTEQVETQFNATPSDSIIGVTRSKIALHGAWRKNIETLVQRLIYR